MFPPTTRLASRTVHNTHPNSLEIFQSFKPKERRAEPNPGLRFLLRSSPKGRRDDSTRYLRSLEHLDRLGKIAFPVQLGRAMVFSRVRKIIEERFGSTYQVETFGSMKYSATSAKSDIDLIILDSSRPYGFDPEDKKPLPRIYKIHALAKALREGGFIKVQPIPASVPIVKFQDKKTGIQCDINVNDQPGYWNSMMIRRYSKLCPHLRYLLIVLKQWAKPRGLNSPSPKAREPVTFSSYALALMTIAFLQQRNLLPNLQENLEPDVKERLFWNRNPLYLCDMRFNWNATRLPDNIMTSVIDLLIQWFDFWGGFDPTQQIVDIRLGGILPRLSAPSELPLTITDAVELGTSPGLEQEAKSVIHEHESAPYNVGALKRWELQTLCIIDPFVRVKNVGGNITDSVFQSFQKECQRAGADLRRWISDQGGGYVI